MTNEQIEQYARIAYEAGPESIFPRTPWDELSPGWKAYWHTLAKAVRKAAMEEAAGICEDEGRKWRKAYEANLECACYDCAATIRAAAGEE